MVRTFDFLLLLKYHFYMPSTKHFQLKFLIQYGFLLHFKVTLNRQIFSEIFLI